MADAVIGRGMWIDKLAEELLDREKELKRDTAMLRVESGLGASGIPHIGSLGDAVRAYGVKLALEDIGYSSELIAYSDDMDGLRKIPEGFPDSLREHIAKPVSLIPDPFGCHDSYGSHMSGLLLEGLDELGIKYRFERAHETYRSGALTEQIHTILCNAEKIGKKIANMVGQEKFQKKLPYFPVCSQCSRLYTAEATEYLKDERKVRYRCGGADIGGERIEGCGCEGEADIGSDLGKLAWKVEFAARWQAFDVRFEAYGKDIMDSVKINDWVSDEILKYPHPHHVRYEMFLDKGGHKISKSLGNVVTSQKWLRYGTPQSILLLLYKRIGGARELGLEDIPALMDEYGQLQDAYFGKTKSDEAKAVRSRGLFEYVHLLEPPGSPAPHTSYRLLVELAGVFRQERTVRITKKLIEYGIISEPHKAIDRMIEMAGRYADDFGGRTDHTVELDGPTKKALSELAEALASGSVDIQDAIYGAAKSNDVRPRDFFRTLYRIILGAERGPKLGPFIADIGPEKVLEMIRRHT